MSLLSSLIPRAREVDELYEEPLGFLARNRSNLGDLFVIRDDGAVFSRSSDCSGSIAAFGQANNRAALSDIELFGMPVSGAQNLSLPHKLVNINCSLHSMRGEQHGLNQRLLLRVLSERSIEDQLGHVSAGLEAFARSWQPGQSIGLLGEMRRLTLEFSSRLFFGDHHVEASELASLIQLYFQLRREATSPFSSADQPLREGLIALGTSLDDALRRHSRWCRRRASASSGLLARLATIELESGRLLSEDEMVAHSNILFVSSTEPVAIALTWIVLILSQLPDLRRALRNELDQASSADSLKPSHLTRLALLDSVINESLRLLPPNALMVRLTTEQASLQGVALPQRCEIVLCPFLAHRDAERFPRPNEFLPSRWRETKPSPFEYFPFGAGGHACVGRHLATYMIKSALAILLQRHDLVLADDQEIDWRIHIQLMPRNEPLMTIQTPGESTSSAGKLLGPVADLISFDTWS
jgi:cytochrome P450